MLILWGGVSATATKMQFDTCTIHVLSLGGAKIREAWLFGPEQDDFDEL